MQCIIQLLFTKMVVINDNNELQNSLQTKQYTAIYSKISLLIPSQTSCMGGRHNIISFRPWKWSLFTCDVGYLCANFSLPRPLCSRLRPNVRVRRQTDVRCASSLNAPALWGQGITSRESAISLFQNESV